MLAIVIVNRLVDVTHIIKHMHQSLPLLTVKVNNWTVGRPGNGAMFANSLLLVSDKPT